MKNLPRLTEQLLARAVRKAGSQPAAWYDLCRQGYLPEEIRVHVIYGTPEIRGKVREHAASHDLPMPANCAKKREYVRLRPKVTDPAAAFRATVMRTGMALVLTQPMLESLCAVACGTESDTRLYCRELGITQPDNFIATHAALEKRGLVTCEHPHRLTKIGQRVVDMLKEAGVFVTPDAALNKRLA